MLGEPTIPGTLGTSPRGRFLDFVRRAGEEEPLFRLYLSKDQKAVRALETEPQQSLIQALSTSGMNYSIFGGLTRNAIDEFFGKKAYPVDPDFELHSRITPDMILQRPWLLSDMQEGFLEGIQSEQAFNRYLMDRDRSVAALDDLSRRNPAMQFALGLASQVPDMLALAITGGAAGRLATGILPQKFAARAGPQALKTFLFGKTTPARLTRPLASGLVNALQEHAVEWIDPLRAKKIDENEAMAFSFGLLLGGALEGASAGLGTLFRVNGAHNKVVFQKLRDDLEPQNLRNLGESIKVGEDQLAKLLEAPVVGPRTIIPPNTPRAKLLVKKLEEKYDEAGEYLGVSDSVDDFMTIAARMEEIGPDADKMLNALDVDGTKFDAAVHRLGDVWRRRMDSLLPGVFQFARGKFRRSVDLPFRSLYRLMFDETLLTSKQAKDPLNHVTYTHAEGLKLQLERHLHIARMEIQEALDQHFKDGGGPIVWMLDGDTSPLVIKPSGLSRRGGIKNLNLMITDYIRKLEEVEVHGRSPDDIANVPQAVKTGAAAVKKWRRDRANQLYQVGLLGVSEDAITDAANRLASTKRSLQTLDEAVSHPGPPDPDLPRPGRTESEIAESGGRIVRESSKARAALQRDIDKIDNVSRINQEIAETADELKLLEEMDPDTATFELDEFRKKWKNYLSRERRKKKKPEIVGRQPYDPPTIDTMVDDANLWYQKRVYDLRMKTTSLKRSLGFARERLDVITDTRSGLEFRIAEIDVLIKQIEEPGDIQIRARNQAAALQKLRPKVEAQIRREAQELENIKQIVKTQQRQVGRTWLPARIRDNRTLFARLLREDFDHFRIWSHDTGKRLTEEELLARPLEPGALERHPILSMRTSPGTTSPLQRVEQYLGKEMKDWTEGDLRNADAAFGNTRHYDDYLNSLKEWHNNKVEQLINDMTDPSHAHGVEDAMGSNHLKERKLLIRESRYRRFLVNDINAIMSQYDNALVGRIAERRAIQLAKDQWAPFVKDVLGEELDLSSEQLIRAVERNLDMQIDLARRVGNHAVEKALLETKDQIPRLLTPKIAELRGISKAFGDPSLEVGLLRLATRAALKITSMAMLGKVLVSSLGDPVNTMMSSNVGRAQLKAIANGLREFAFFKEFRNANRHQLAGLALSLDEGLMRCKKYMNTDDMPANQNWGRGRRAELYEKADQFVDRLNESFFTMTLMSRWNAVWKGQTARLMIHHMYQGAIKMQRAADLVKQGQTESQALRNAGLTRGEAGRLNRLGLNAETSGRVVNQFRKYGEDTKGNRVTSETNFDEMIHPNFLNWDDKNLIESFTAAVNSEVDNLIVTPKLMSRPLSHNGGYAFLARAFNQFQSFAFAHGQQLVPIATTTSPLFLSKWLMAQIAVGALVDALHLELKVGRNHRDFEESAKRWTDPKKIFGQLYAAIDRTGNTGWLARPLNIQTEGGFGLGRLMGNNVSSAQAAQAVGMLGNLGPLASWTNMMMGATLTPFFTDAEMTPSRVHMARLGTPYNNHFLLAGAFRLTSRLGIENPLGIGYGLDLFGTYPGHQHRSRKHKYLEPE